MFADNLDPKLNFLQVSFKTLEIRSHDIPWSYQDFLQQKCWWNAKAITSFSLPAWPSGVFSTRESQNRPKLFGNMKYFHPSYFFWFFLIRFNLVCTFVRYTRITTWLTSRFVPLELVASDSPASEAPWRQQNWMPEELVGSFRCWIWFWKTSELVLQ